MPGSGALRRLGAGSEVDEVIQRPEVFDQSGTAGAVAADYFFGVAPPPVTVIPYDWLSPPATFRADAPINDPQITNGRGGIVQSPNAASIATYGDFPLQVTLSTISDGDAPALAYWFSTYYAGFRMRSPSLTINLLDARRTQAEIWRVVGVRIGDRISIPDAPGTWPQGANTMFVEGITHTVSQNGRTVTFNCSPVIGSTPGTAGPWFTADNSFAGSTTDLAPF